MERSAPVDGFSLAYERYGADPGSGPAVMLLDVGSRVAQQIARDRPNLVRALVLAPPMPGAGSRVLSERAVGEFWYQNFHRLELAERLIDGNPAAARTYLEHFWGHWSGPGYAPDPAEFAAAITAAVSP